MCLLPPLDHIHGRPLHSQEIFNLYNHILQQPRRPRLILMPLLGRREIPPRVKDLPRILGITGIEIFIPRAHDPRPSGRAPRKDTRGVERVRQRKDVFEGDRARGGPVAEEALQSAGRAHRAARVAADGDVEPGVRGDSGPGAGGGAAGGLVAVSLSLLISMCIYVYIYMYNDSLDWI